MDTYSKLELTQSGLIDQAGNPTSGVANMVLRLLDAYTSSETTVDDKEMAVDIFSRLVAGVPITPLTGEDSEWVSIGDDENPLWKNTRCSTVFKDNDGAWDTDVFVNWSWVCDPSFNDGKPFKMYFIDENQKVKVTFPYMKELAPNKVFIPTETFPEEYI